MSLILTFKVKKPLDTVFEYLTDMDKFVSIHPVIDKIEPLSNNNFLVHETLKFGFIPVSFRYQFFLNMNLLEKTVEMNATVMKFTKINMVFSLKWVDNTTVIKEAISIKTPFPLQSIIESIFKKQHIQLFKNIENTT
jgi:carbon monoxide dehydrogenase subunit G